MAKILLINPPVTRDEQFVRGSKYAGGIVTPLGLAYVAAHLENNGHKVNIIDGMAENKTMEKIAKKSKSYDVVGITSITLFSLRAHETAMTIKEVDEDIPIMMGGPHPSVAPSEVLGDENVDYVVLGEGEITAKELVDAIEGKKKIEKILGLAYRKNGKFKFNGNRPLVKNLDEIPMPARHLLPMDLYFTSEARAKDKKAFSIITTRGCPHNCSFCSNKEMFRRVFRAHSSERVVDEMELLVEEYNAKEIDFWDDNFMLNKKRVTEICDLIKERGIEVNWHVQGRVDFADPKVLTKMKESGCYYIAYGVESGSERILKDVGKNITKDQIRKAFKMAKKVGLMIRGYFILGFVGETIEEMNQTIEFARELNPDIASFSLLTPLPGTRDFIRAQTEGKFDKDYYKKRIIPEFNFLDRPVYVPEGLTEKQLLDIHKKAYRSFYLRPSLIAKQIKSIRSMSDINRLIKGGLAILNT